MSVLLKNNNNQFIYIPYLPWGSLIDLWDVASASVLQGHLCLSLKSNYPCGDARVFEVIQGATIISCNV